MNFKISNNFSNIIVLLLIVLCYSEYDIKNNETCKGKCIFMLSDSSSINFHYLKSKEDENK
jgi:hypothetical protein